MQNLSRLGRFPILQRLTTGLRQAIISLVAAFCAYIPTHLIGLHQGFWSAITAIAVAQARFQDTETTARKQFTGAAIGGIVAVCLIFGFGDDLAVYAAAIIVSIIACWLLNVSDSSQLAGITATIILLVPHTGSPELMLVSRLSEVGWGVCAGVAIVWLEGRLFVHKL